MSLINLIPREYNPQIGVVEQTGVLTTGKPFLYVGFPNGHQVRAIVTSDLLTMDEVPVVGTIVEVAQADRIWTYIRTVNTNIPGSRVIAGDSAVSVLPAQIALSTGSSVVGVSRSRLLLNSGDTFLLMDNGGLTVGTGSGGIEVSDGVRLTSGLTGGIGKILYEDDPFFATSLPTSSAGSGFTLHNHTVNLSKYIGTSDRFTVELGDAITAPGTPDGLAIVDLVTPLVAFRSLQWNTVADAVYMLKYGYAAFGDKAGIAAAMAGTAKVELTMIATGMVGTEFRLETVGRETGKYRLMGEDTPPSADIEDIRSVEVIAFAVRAVSEDTAVAGDWSEEKRLYYVNLVPGD